MGAAAIPLILSAVGTGASMYNNNQVQKRQEEATAEGLRQQQVRQQQADAAVASQINNVKNSSPEASREASTKAFMDQLQRSRQQAITTGGGDRYGNELNAAGTDVDNYGKKVADTLARISAPELQRQGEAQQFARTASDLGGISRNSAADDFLTQLRLRSIRPDAGIGALGSLAGGVANGLASNGRGVKVPKPVASYGADPTYGTQGLA